MASIKWKREGSDVNSKLTKLQVSTPVLLLNLSGCYIRHELSLGRYCAELDFIINLRKE